jgi:DNA-binding transcriptional ArsR family regulator
MIGHPHASGVASADPVAMAGIFAALGDPTRASLLTDLVGGGRGTATSLAVGRDISRQAVDRHLRVLEGAGLVESRRHGREVVYALNPGTVASSAGWLEDLGRTWERKLLTIKALAEGGA